MSSMMRALVTVPGKTAEVKTIAHPIPEDGEILVKVVCVAQNPTDWKAMKAVPPGRTIGCDFSGTIADPNGSQWAQEQRIAGFVHGTWPTPARGAFAEYLVTEASSIYAIPDSVSFEAAAAVPLPFATAVQAMLQRLGLPEIDKPADTPYWVLVNGGTSSVGKYAVQLGKLAGVHVIATGSKRNFALLEELGAKACVDYSEADWPAQVRRVTGGKLAYAFDCISEGGTTGKCAAALDPETGGHIVTLLPVPQEEITKVSEHVRVESTIVYSVFGRQLNYKNFDNCGEARPEDKKVWSRYLEMLPRLLDEGTVKPNRIREMKGGLEGILEGFRLQEAGKVSAEKLVYRVA